MFKQNRFSVVARFVSILILLAGVIGAVPTRAEAGRSASDETASSIHIQTPLYPIGIGSGESRLVPYSISEADTISGKITSRTYQFFTQYDVPLSQPFGPFPVNIAMQPKTVSEWNELVYLPDAVVVKARSIKDYAIVLKTTFKGISLSGSEFSADASLVLLLPPNGFSKASPANGATVPPTGQSLQWNGSLGAVDYEYCFDTIDNNSCDTNWTGTYWLGTYDTNAALQDLPAETTFYWQVRANNTTGTTYANNGVWWAFSTAPLKVTKTTDTNDGVCDSDCSLREAVANAVTGNTITFDPVLSGQTIVLTSTITIQKSITIDGAGLNPRVEISGGNAVRIFLIDSTSAIAPSIRNVVLKEGRQTGLSYIYFGGAMFVGNNTTLTIENTHITNNSAYAAGAIYISPYAVVNISNSEISNNTTDTEGSAIHVKSIGILNLTNSVISNNVSGGAGTIYFTGATNTSTIENNRFSNNSAMTGGAILGQLGNARIEIRGNLFEGNQATHPNHGGGAIRFSASTIPTLIILENNTFHNNISAGIGGAVYLEVAADYYLINNTFSGNAATTGGNLYLAGGSSVPRMYNNIIANHAGGGDCYAFSNSFTIGGNNLVEDGGSLQCLASLTGDPMLLSLADNGGFTQTMALQFGSPAIDAGNDSYCPATDQRGVTRPQGIHCDIGAYEYQPPPTTPTYTPSPTATATVTPTNTSTPTATPTFTPTNTFTPTSTPSYSYQPLYLSLTNNQTIGGVTSADEDILKFDGQNWSMFFDGSDVGLGATDLFGFSILDEDTILLAFNSPITVNGISVTPRDMMRFDATSLGSVTAGTFSMYLNGIDVGLDATAENIDSISLLTDGRVLISTTGNPSVPGLSGLADEDILAFTPSTLGDNTSGTWSVYFDGSDVGLSTSADEDVDALDVASNGAIYLSTLGNFAVTGVSGADEDVFTCTPTSLGSVTACNYSSLLYFDGSTWGLDANDVDAFNLLVLASNPTPTITPTPSFTPTATQTSSITPTPTTTPTTATSTALSTPPPFLFIQVVQPNGGEVITVGSTYRITWDSSANIDTVTLGYKSCDSCLDWIVNNIPNIGYYDWNVDVGNTANTQFKIYAIGYATGFGSTNDESDNNFTILQPTATPTSTVTSTITATATRTPTRTLTVTITRTPTRTVTPTPTRTNTPTVTATAPTSGFPSSAVLDNFNRANGAIGSTWSGTTSGYSIASNRLDVGTGDTILWNTTSFGTNQEAFVTLTTIDPNGFYQDLLLKSQSATTWNNGVIDVSYDAVGHRIQVWTFSSAQGWVQRGADISVTFVNGDQFGARVRSNGTVEIYRNGVLIATRDVSAWTYSANGGYIGMLFQDASNAVLDDFGGGSISP